MAKENAKNEQEAGGSIRLPPAYLRSGSGLGLFEKRKGSIKSLPGMRLAAMDHNR